MARKRRDSGADRVRLRALTDDDVAAHNAGEDDQTIRWLSGTPSTTQSTRRHFEMLALNERRGAGKRGFGVLLDGELAGYIDFDPDADDLPEPGDVNIAYAVHPRARRQGVATAAISLLCARLQRLGVGRRAIIRAEIDNAPSAAAARRSGFFHLGDFPALGEAGPGGEPVIYRTFGRLLTDSSS
ncbi:GNAT family N-acetyltransferase [Curtobacterium sp. NPDC089991]|uniref:GNAT family N-acetyltransferase n=1 Tax=Curtobacterium sp. NPDC089991 TaxID=3363969 RepID=UPI00381277FC